MNCCKICGYLILIGAINWGLVGLGNLIGSDLNVVHMLLGSVPYAEDVVYVLVGLAGVKKLVGGAKCIK